MSGAHVDLRLDERAGGTIAFLTVDNRAKLNTLDSKLMREFIAAVEGLAARDDLRALVLSGAGDKAFIGGASIPEMAALDPPSARDFITLVHRTCDACANCRCRSSPASTATRWARGWKWRCPAICASQRAAPNSACRRRKSAFRRSSRPRSFRTLIGYGRARELLMLGEIIDADTALRWGLVERVVEPAVLDAEVDKVVTALLSAGAQAVRAQKALMQQWEKLPTDAAIAAGIDAFASAYATEEPKRMMAAFLTRKRD